MLELHRLMVLFRTNSMSTISTYKVPKSSISNAQLIVFAKKVQILCTFWLGQKNINSFSLVLNTFHIYSYMYNKYTFYTYESIVACKKNWYTLIYFYIEYEQSIQMYLLLLESKLEVHQSFPIQTINNLYLWIYCFI